MPVSTRPPTTSSSQERAQADGRPDPTIAVGVGSSTGVIVFIIICLLAVLVRRKIRLKRYLANANPWNVDLSQIELLEEIGNGAFGKVWKGTIDRNVLDSTSSNTSKKNQHANEESRKVVAIKMLHEGASEQEHNDFLAEIEFMRNVGQHRHIITMIACCTKQNQAFLVVEYAEHGDLLHLLRDKRKEICIAPVPSSSTSEDHRGLENDDQEDNDAKESLEGLLEELNSFSWQIAQGMEYLSSKRIVHRDLAARNVLVAEGLVAKVADFGLSRNVNYESKMYQISGSHRRLPIKWLSSEALIDQIFTSKSDIWSYGVVLWEIYSMGKVPYHTLCNDNVLGFLRNGQRMEKPDLCPQEIYELMQSCWLENAQDRPSFSDVIKTMETLMTHDKPYLELLEIATEGNDGYSVPLDISDNEENEVSDMV